MIDAERRQRIDDLCHAALDRPADQRSAFLAAACNGDEPLRQEAEKRAADEKAAADKRAADAQAEADRKAAADKAVADKKAAEEKAAADKNQMALATAGDALVEDCGACHMAFDPGAK